MSGDANDGVPEPEPSISNGHQLVVSIESIDKDKHWSQVPPDGVLRYVVAANLGEADVLRAFVEEDALAEDIHVEHIGPVDIMREEFHVRRCDVSKLYQKHAELCNTTFVRMLGMNGIELHEKVVELEE